MKTLLLSMRVSEAESYYEDRNSIAFDYIDFFEKLGFLIYLIPNNSINLDEYLKLDVDLIVLSGGNNLDPSLYKSDFRTPDVYPNRDATEYKLLNFALQNHVKVLGICRGLHLINVYFTGQLSHNIANHVNKNHTLISKNKLLNGTKVNSFHNHCVTQQNLSEQMIPIAKTEDGAVECAIHRNKCILGIQWHPERQESENDKEFISLFLRGEL
tara:strand:- start:793 stop:1431 length:639 start_codon:yes stop_codon:yes gene_type:complete